MATDTNTPPFSSSTTVQFFLSCVISIAVKFVAIDTDILRLIATAAAAAATAMTTLRHNPYRGDVYGYALHPGKWFPNFLMR